MKTKLLILALLLGGTLQAQKILEYRNSDKELVDTYQEATWIKTYEKVVLDSVNPSEHYVQIANKEGFVPQKYWYDSKKLKKLVDSKIYHCDGELKIHRTYLKGKQTSFKLFYEDGSLKRIEDYKKGKFQDGVCYDSQGNEIEFFPYIEKASFPGGMKEFYTYLKESIDRTTLDHNLLRSGTRVEVKFSIDSSGKVSKLSMVKSSGITVVDVAVLNVMATCPLWNPARIDKEAVEVRYTLPIVLN
ncbi:MAG: TonB family protein [Flavobacteriaceae bacterium]